MSSFVTLHGLSLDKQQHKFTKSFATEGEGKGGGFGGGGCGGGGCGGC